MKKIVLMVLTCVLCTPLIMHAQNCGTTNIALNRPVTVSNEEQFHVGAQAVDGNFSNAWFATGDTNFIYVDLG
jgi:hypothetical protein